MKINVEGLLIMMGRIRLLVFVIYAFLMSGCGGASLDSPQATYDSASRAAKANDFRTLWELHNDSWRSFQVGIAGYGMLFATEPSVVEQMRKLGITKGEEMSRVLSKHGISYTQLKTCCGDGASAKGGAALRALLDDDKSFFVDAAGAGGLDYSDRYASGSLQELSVDAGGDTAFGKSPEGVRVHFTRTEDGWLIGQRSHAF